MIIITDNFSSSQQKSTRRLGQHYHAQRIIYEPLLYRLDASVF